LRRHPNLAHGVLLSTELALHGFSSSVASTRHGDRHGTTTRVTAAA
jgi:hypothetical protein